MSVLKLGGTALGVVESGNEESVTKANLGNGGERGREESEVSPYLTINSLEGGQWGGCGESQEADEERRVVQRGMGVFMDMRFISLGNLKESGGVGRMVP